MHKKTITYLCCLLLFFAATGYVIFGAYLGVKSVVLGQVAWLLPALTMLPLKQHIIKLPSPQMMIFTFLALKIGQLFCSVGLVVLVLSTCKIQYLGFLYGYVLTIGAMLFLKTT